jgi:hypothetical protein
MKSLLKKKRAEGSRTRLHCYTLCVWRRGIWSCSGVSLWRPGFNPKPVHVGFVVDKVAVGEWILVILVLFSHQYHYTISTFDTVIK